MAPQTVDIALKDGRTGKTPLYIQLIDKIKSLPIVLQVNTQFYNSGSQLAFDGSTVTQGSVDFLTGQVDNLIQGAKLDPSMVTIGLPTNFNAAGDGKINTGYVENEVIAQALDCLVSGSNCGKYTPKGKYANFGGVMGFSMNWDAFADNVFAKGVGSKLQELKKRLN